MLRKIVIPIIFIIGLLVFFYPMLGNWLSAKVHHTVINEHNEALEEMTEEEKELERLKAEEYNEMLTEEAIPITDPFAEDKNEEIDEDINTSGYFNVLDIGKSMGVIEIPNIDVNLPIYHGVGDDVLTQGIGHLSNSSIPVGGNGSHAVLTGHRGLPSSKLFRDLDKLDVGDAFYIHTLGETLAYQVDDIQIVLPNENQWLVMEEDKDYVTLITCEPYMINSHRLLVRGERRPHETTMPVKTKQIKHLPKDTIQKVEYGLIVGGMSVIVMLLIIVAFRLWRKKGVVK